ncbi:DUF4873 domain-containing protein [Mycolicibacterium hippocampi]|uniref:Cyclohexanone monooxygenase n=1 Tax=Mycolicibacterium hippocampi TaxID=659824 RepID=A0A850PXB2_9MYCO|nr:Cyclohexanone monooxygenase [Mycolicibacterium hippocampi]
MTDVDTVAYVGRRETEQAAFDEATHTWTVDGRRARVLIATDGTLPAAFACRADGLEPYLGVAVHGVPNYFLITGPDNAAQKGYIAKCIAHLGRTGSTRIEVRASTQRFYDEHSRGPVHRRGLYWRRVGRRIPSAFEVRGHGDDADDDAVYDGPASVVIGDRTHQTQARLTGWVDPIDGRYHWQGTIFDAGFKVRLPQEVTVAVDGHAAEARLTERTPWSTYLVVGVGAPPFALADIEVDVPLL